MLENEGFNSKDEIEVYNNLIIDDYISDDNYTLGKVMGNLTLENVLYI